MNMLHKWRAFFLVAATLLTSSLAVAGIASTKHNLSASGTGTYKATAETQICVYCHAPHNANPSAPLWNHTLSGAIYQPYSSNTMKAAAPGQPTGGSKLCLTCHDGTVALGSAANVPGTHFQPGVITGLATTLLGTSANVGTDLRNDHPVSFTYDSALAAGNTEVVNPTTLTGKIKPEPDGQLQCTSCHDPHSSVYPKFMLTGYQDGAGYGSPLCRTCHNKEYYSTVPNMGHRESTRMWNGLGLNPWHISGQNLANNANSTPKSNACENCHQPHASLGGELLLKQDGESGVCLVCHNGNVAQSNLQTLLTTYPYKHPISEPANAGRHTIARQLDGKVRENQSNLANRHAECADCHNPHAVSAGTSPDMPNPTSNLASNVLKGVWGVEPVWPGNWTPVTTYTQVQDIQYQYQLCMKCHSYYAFGNTPPVDPYGKITGGINTDQALEFNPNNASYHPVVAKGKNPYILGSSYAVPKTTGTSYAAGSLINGMTPNSTMTCADCHSAQPPGVAAPKGPHAAPYWPILYAPWDSMTGRNNPEALCFKCHDAPIYGVGGADGGWGSWGGWSGGGGGWGGGGGGSGAVGTGYSTSDGWNLHQFHVGGRGLPCQTCHAAVPHGWKRPHMLIFGVGPNRDPAPYNSHYNTQVGIPTDFGSRNGVTLETVKSGQYQCSYCHGTNLGVGGWGGRW